MEAEPEYGEARMVTHSGGQQNTAWGRIDFRALFLSAAYFFGR
jgi:hypothetical protein